MIDSSAWLDPAFAEREHEHLWGKCWLLAAHVSRLRAAGDYVLFDLGRRSAVLTRDAENRVRAFANVCAHRGARLVDASGHADCLRCPYHGFRWGLDGALLEAPHLERAPELRLVELGAAERAGFVWVAFSRDVEPIDGFLAPVLPELEALGLGAWRVSHDVTVPIACNWKISADVHAEALHVPTLHSEIADYVDWKNAEITQLGAHARIEVAPRAEGLGKNTLYYLFPNAHLNLHPDEGFLLRHRPDRERADRTDLDQLGLSRRPGPSVSMTTRVEIDDPRIGPVTAADLRIAERVQRGLATGALERPAFTPAEKVLGWMLAEIERRLG